MSEAGEYFPPVIFGIPVNKEVARGFEGDVLRVYNKTKEAIGKFLNTDLEPTAVASIVFRKRPLLPFTSPTVMGRFLNRTKEVHVYTNKPEHLESWEDTLAHEIGHALSFQLGEGRGYTPKASESFANWIAVITKNYGDEAAIKNDLKFSIIDHDPPITLFDLSYDFPQIDSAIFSYVASKFDLETVVDLCKNFRRPSDWKLFTSLGPLNYVMMKTLEPEKIKDSPAENAAKPIAEKMYEQFAQFTQERLGVTLVELTKQTKEWLWADVKSPVRNL